MNRFIDGGEEGYGIYSFTILLISTLSSVVSYSVLLWSISAQLAFPIAKGVVLPGWLFWVALVYALGGTLATHWIGRPLTGLMFERQRREADFRFSLARMREYGEQVALLSGETTERASLGKRFGAIVANYLDIIGLRKRLVAFTATYHQLSGIFPLAVVAPFMLIGQIKFGVVRQTLDAFAEVEGALNFIVNYYTYLADYRSVLDRLATFDAATERADVLMSRSAAQPTEKSDLALDLALTLPDGRRIVEARGIRTRQGRIRVAVRAFGLRQVHAVSRHRGHLALLRRNRRNAEGRLPDAAAATALYTDRLAPRRAHLSQGGQRLFKRRDQGGPERREAVPVPRPTR